MLRVNLDYDVRFDLRVYVNQSKQFISLEIVFLISSLSLSFYFISLSLSIHQTHYHHASQFLCIIITSKNIIFLI